jgi:hypothetical protein
MTDLGKGDVVAAVQDLDVPARWTGHGEYHVRVGQRAIVVEVRQPCGFCTRCGHKPDLVGLRLEEYPLVRGVLWCPCEWRKIGGSEADTVAQFAGYLKTEILTPGAFRRLIEKVR